MARAVYISPVQRWLPALFFGLLCASALAQNPTPTPPARNFPGAPDTVRLQFPNADVKDVLAFYERLTGKKIVYDNTVIGPVNIVINSEIPREEAVKIIEINLLLNGFSLVPEDNSIIKVVGLQKNPRTAAVPIYSDLNQLPETERIVTFLFKLQYADPTELQQTLVGSQYLAPTTYTNVVALPKAQALLITDSTGVIRSLAKVISEIDVPPAEVVSEFIKLERADVKDVLDKLEKIFAPPQTTPTTTSIIRPGGGNGAPLPPGAQQNATVVIDRQGTGLSEDSVIVGRIWLTADVRTNRIHVITRPINMPFVRKLVHEFDSDVPFGEPAKRTLKFVSASDVLDIVVKTITEPGVKPDETSATGAATPRPTTTTGTRTNSNNTQGSGSSSGGVNISEELNTPDVDTTPKAVTVGNTKIIADPRENTIIVLGNQEMQQRVFRLLDTIDVRAPQVMLNTVIGELTLNNDLDIGIDPLALLTNPATTSNSSTTGTTGTSTTTGASNVATAAAAAFATHGGSLMTSNGLTQYVVATRTLSATVQALEATGRFRVTQRPMVFTSNNKKAIIASGTEIAVPSSTLSNLVAGTALNNTAAVQSTVNYKPVVLQLEVVPLINADREVSLDILQKLDDLSGQTTNIGGSLIPTINTRYIRTNVLVPNEATVVLGGLIKTSLNNTGTGLPLLGRIPVLGYLFKKTSKHNDREELVVLIRPVVTTSSLEAVKNSDTEQHRLLIQPTLDATLDQTVPHQNADSRAVNFRYQK